MVVISDPEVMWGTSVFEEMRVPAATLVDYLAAGDTLDAFLGDYPEGFARIGGGVPARVGGEIQSELKAA